MKFQITACFVLLAVMDFATAIPTLRAFKRARECGDCGCEQHVCGLGFWCCEGAWCINKVLKSVHGIQHKIWLIGNWSATWKRSRRDLSIVFRNVISIWLPEPRARNKLKYKYTSSSIWISFGFNPCFCLLSLPWSLPNEESIANSRCVFLETLPSESPRRYPPSPPIKECLWISSLICHETEAVCISLDMTNQYLVLLLEECILERRGAPSMVSHKTRRLVLTINETQTAAFHAGNINLTGP